MPYPYSKQTWNDGDPTTPISGTRLGAIESGIFGASLVYNIQNYGAIGGSHDDGSSFQSALNDAAPNGGIVYIPHGTWTWKTVPQIPYGLANQIVIKGEGAASVVQLTSNAPRFLDMQKIKTTSTGSQSIPASPTSFTFNVTSTAGFAASGELSSATASGSNGSCPVQITYTGITSTTFTGCTTSSGAQTITAGAQVEQAHLTYQNFTLKDFCVDNNNLTGKNAIVFGTWISGSNQYRMNLSNLWFENLTVINAVATQDLSSNQAGLHMVCTHGYSNEATQNTISNITIKNFSCTGGNFGVLINGSVSNGTTPNVRIDKILVDQLYHTLGGVLNIGNGGGNFFSSANLQIGSRATVGTLRVRGVRGYYAGDVGIEIDSAQDALMEDCIIEDAFTAPFVYTNFRTPDDANAQRIVWRACHGRRILAPHGSCFQASNSNSIPLGNIEIHNCSWYKNEPTLQTDSTALSFDSVEFRSLVVNGLRSTYVGVNSSSGTFFLAPVGIINPTNTRAYVTLRDIHTYFGGTFSGTTLQWETLRLSGLMELIMDGYTWQDATTTSTAAWGGIVGYASGSSINGHFKGIRYRGSVVTTPLGFRVGSTTNLTIPKQIIMADCDFSQVPSTGTDVFFSTPTNIAKVSMPRNIWHTMPILPSSITVTASPFTYQNLDGYAEHVLVNGGSIVSIQRSQDNSTFYDTGLTQGTFFMDSGDYLKVTYNLAPTMTKWPVK